MNLIESKPSYISKCLCGSSVLNTESDDDKSGTYRPSVDNIVFSSCID